jgi:AcrR family transcriptional regulator
MAADATSEPVTVWERPARGARGPAPERSRAEVTAAAIALADESGLAAVTMRRVAGHLGTGPASLYRYVSSRDELIDLMTDAMTGEIDLTAPLSGDPVADLLALASQAKALHVSHPWLLDVPPERLRLGPRGLDYLEHALAAIAPAALPGHARLEAVALLSGLTKLFARTELQAAQTSAERHAAQSGYLARAAAEGTRPLLAAALAESTASGLPEDPQALFMRTTRRVLTGLLTGDRE